MAVEYKRSFSKRLRDAEEQAADLEKSLDDSSRYLRVVYDSVQAQYRVEQNTWVDFPLP